jgi:hypothetical protein
MTAKVGFCWHCGALTAFRCARCKHFVCVTYGSATPSVGCSRLRKASGQVGVYRLVCWPKCVHRRDPVTIARVNQRVQEQGGEPEDPDAGTERAQLDLLEAA